MNTPPPTSDPQPHLVDTASGEIAITDEGTRHARAILCVHGLPGSSRDFRYLAPHLSGRWRVIRVEMPGFAQSPPSAVNTVDGWSQVLHDLREALGLDRPLLLAHSFGGGSCLLAANRHPDRIAGLVLLASMGPRVHRALVWPPRVHAGAARLVRFPLTRHMISLAVKLAYRQQRVPVPANWCEVLLHLELIASVDFAAIAAAASSLPMPVLVAFSSDDRLVQPAIQKELAALLPHSTTLEFPTGGHHLQKHRAPDIAAAIDRVFGKCLALKRLQTP